MFPDTFFYQNLTLAGRRSRQKLLLANNRLATATCSKKSSGNCGPTGVQCRPASSSPAGENS